MPTRRVLTLAALVVGLAAAPAASADIIPTTPLPACGSPPCLVSVLHGATPLPYPSTSGDEYSIFASTYTLIGARYFSFLIDDGTATMTTADEFTIAINTGSTYPAETFARGQDVVVTRSGTFLGPFTVRMTLRPVRMAYGEPGGCNSSGACGMTAPTLDTAQLNGQIDNLGYIVDPADKAAMRGFDLASNTDWVSTPLRLDYATNSIVLDVANSHFEPDGTTVFRGAAEFRIPNAMLRRIYHVDHPPSLTASAFSVTTGSGPAATVVDINPGSVHVAISGLTFSKRRLRIHGDTRPLRPRDLRATRIAAHRAVLRFNSSRRRGSLVRGYIASCRLGTRIRARGQSFRPPIRVSGLIPGRSYTCRVRARSRAGLSRAARTVIPGVSSGL
jgi:hypothetical protein